MRKLSTIFLSMALFFVGSFMNVQAQITVEIGMDGTAINANMPLSIAYPYTYSQQIYLNSEMGEGKNGMKITQIQFYSDGHSDFNNVGDIRVWMGHTTKSTFTANNDMIPYNQLTLVATIPGQVNWTPNTWVTINLNDPFIYESSSKNLVIAIHESLTGASTVGTGNFKTKSTGAALATSRAVASVASGTPPTNPNPETITSASRQTVINTIKITGYLVQNPTAATSSASNIESNTATISGQYANLSNPTFTGFKYWLATDPTTVYSAAATGGQMAANLENLLPFSSYKYTAYISWDNGTNFVTGDTLTFKTACPKPSNLSVELVTANTAKLSWTAAAVGSSHKVEYRIAGGEWEEATTTEKNTWNLSSLTPATHYEVKVSTVCDAENRSLGISENFTTLTVYRVTVSAASHGTITPQDETDTEVETGVYLYEAGSEPIFVITPNLGYERDSVLLDNADVTASVSEAGTYTFASLADNHILSATFKPLVYTITYLNLNGAANTNNPSTYTIETPTFTLATLADITDSVFVAWYNNPAYTEPSVAEIALGSKGDTVLWAKWQAIPDDGVHENTIQNVQVYAYGNTVYVVNKTQIPLKSMEIMDVTGRVVYSSTSVQNSVNLDLAKGQYIVRLMSHDSVLNTKVMIR